MMNNEDFYGTLNLRPASKLALRSEVHALRLANAADLWYSGGGAFQPQTFGYTGRPSNGSRGLANVWDISADYQVTRSLQHHALLRPCLGQERDCKDLSQGCKRAAHLSGDQLPLLSPGIRLVP